MDNFKIVNNFFANYFVNSESIYIFAALFMNKAKTTTTEQIIYY